VTSVVGGVWEDPPVPHTFVVTVRSRDRLVLCTDGVHDAVRVTAVSARNPSRVAWDLVDAALAVPDADGNATVVVLDVP